jgi:Membrane proteins related to metalloendopeptidases
MRLFKACTLIFALVLGSSFIFQSLLGDTSLNEPFVCQHDHAYGNDFQNNKDQLLFIIEEDQPNGDVVIYAKNIGFCPLTVDIQFPDLTNMATDVALPFTAVVPTRSEKFKLLTIAPSKNFKGGNMSYRYSFNYNVGDIINAKHNDDYEYLLPFASNKSYIVGQGYGGRYSHQNLNCLDFNMDVGSKVCAAREGTVIRVKEDSNTGCKTARCQGKANYIVIYHEDGTSARYIHLKHNGSKVEIGDEVKAGDVIGYSGNTGWSSGPHLHFEVNQPGKNIVYTIPTKFKTKDGMKRQLNEGVSYTAN